MSAIAPNLSALVGTSVAAKLMAAAAGLVSLSKLPASAYVLTFTCIDCISHVIIVIIIIIIIVVVVQYYCVGCEEESSGGSVDGSCVARRLHQVNKHC